MKNIIVFVALVGLLLVHKCTPSPMGAPESRCLSMTPGHVSKDGKLFEPQTGPSPYKITYSLKSVDSDDYAKEFYVSIITDDPNNPMRDFKGFFIQARPAALVNQTIGTWTTDVNSTRLSDCFDKIGVLKICNDFMFDF